MADISIGRRIAFYRRAQRLGQLALATRVGVSVDYVSSIERGIRTPAIDVLLRLADVLGVPAAALLGEMRSEPTWFPGQPSMPAIEQALVGVGQASDKDELDPAALHARVRSVWDTWEGSPARFSKTGPVLPALILDVIKASASFQAPADIEKKRESLRTGADLYFLLRAYLRQTGRLDLSLLAADRALRAALDADDAIRIAVGQWEMAHALLASGQLEGANEVAVRASETIQATAGIPNDQVQAMVGALALVATIAEVRRGRIDGGLRRIIEDARPRADALGETALWGTWFGPSNVGLHFVAIEMETGKPSLAIRYANQIHPSQLGSIERRSRRHLDLARCYDQLGDDPAVLGHLLDAERESPEDLRSKPLARDLVRSLLGRSRRTRLPEIRALANRLGVQTA